MAATAARRVVRENKGTLFAFAIDGKEAGSFTI